MRRILALAAVLGLLGVAHAETNTPFAVDQWVLVRTGTQNIVGQLKDAPAGWLKVQPHGAAVVAIPISAVESVTTSSAPVGPSLAALAGQDSAKWKLRSKHFLYGMPRILDDRYKFTPAGETEEKIGISVLVREGFVVGHADKYRVPLWVSMQWTRDDYLRSEDEQSYGRPFAEDEELPPYARAGTSYNWTVTGLDRGHMARHKDNRAWGEDNSDAGCLMSNVAPQKSSLNQYAWLSIEDEHRDIVNKQSAGITRLWVISGTIFDQGVAVEKVNDIGVPHATYKVIGWFKDSTFHCRGYILKQTDSKRDPKKYLVSVDTVEQRTGLDFFSELDDAIEDAAEAETATTLWGD